MAEPEDSGADDGGGERVNAITATGRVVNVPASAVDGVAYRPASSEEVAAARLQRDYGGYAGMAAAGAAGALRGATVGLSDVAGAALGLDDELAALQRANPIISGAGEFGGALLGAGKLAGAGAAARGARALSAPARAAIAAGEGVEAAMGGGRLAAATGAAVEGVISGAGMGISELALSNEELTAEALVGTIGRNAMMGGAFGGAIGGAVGLVGAGASGVSDAVRGALARPGREGAEELARAAGARGGVLDAVADRLTDAWDATAHVVSGTERGAIARMVRRGEDGRRGLELATQGAEELGRRTDDVYGALNRVHQMRQRAADLATGDLKFEQIAKKVRRGNEAQTMGAARGVVGTLRARLDDIRAAPGKYGRRFRGKEKNLLEKIDHLDTVLDDLAKRGDDLANARAFEELDKLKQDLGKTTKKLARARDKTSGDHAKLDELKDLYEGLRKTLEDTDLWGDAAAMQRRMNAPWSQQIPTNQHFTKQFLSQVEKPGWDGPHFEVDKGSVEKFLNGSNAAEMDFSAKRLDEWLQKTDDFVKTGREALDVGDADRALFDSLEREVSTLRESLTEARKVAGARATMDTLQKSSGGGALAGGLIGGGMAGGMLGGPLAATLGAATSAITNPALAVRRLGAMMALTKRVEGKIGGAIAKVVRGQGSGGTRAIARTARYGAETARAALDKRERIEKRLADARRAAVNPAAAQQRLTQAIGDASGAVPSVHQQALTTAQRANDYLLSQMPPLTPRLVGPQPALSKSELERLGRIVDVVDDPLSALDMLEDGTLTRDHVDAIQSVYPALHQQMQTAALTDLADAQARGEVPPYQARLQLGVLLGIPTDVTLETEVLAAIQGSYAPLPDDQPAGPAGTDPPKLSGAYKLDDSADEDF